MDNKSLGTIGVVVAVAISLVSLAFAFSSSSGGGDVGGQRGGFQELTNGVTLGNFSSTAGAQVEWFSGTLDPQANEEVIFRNTLGKDVYVDYAEINVITGETASSTTKIFAFATTSSSIATWADFGTLAEGKRAIIHGVAIATSTTATTTSSVYAASAGLGNGAVLVPNDSYFHIFLQQDTAGCSIAGAAAGACETATSSSRGFDPQFKVRIHY